MNIISVYVVTQYCSMRPGGTCDVQRHNENAELYAPALSPGDWYVIRTIGVVADGMELELSRVIVKR